VKINNFNLQLEQIENNMEQKNKKIKKKKSEIINVIYNYFVLWYF